MTHRARGLRIAGGVAIGVLLSVSTFAIAGRVPEWTRVAAVVVAATALLLVLVVAPRWQVSHLAVSAGTSDAERFEAENEARRTLAQIIGGVFLFFGAYSTWGQLDLTRQAQITERFTHAVEQLGGDRLEVRLGGIYALERIARDSERDHAVVMELLTTFVREKSPCPASSGCAETKAPRPEVQAAVKVIGRREARFEGNRLRWWDLSHGDLNGVDLTDARLDHFILANSSLQHGNLGGARLEHSDLANASLEHADLGAAHLEEAKLEDASLRCADLRGTVLTSIRAARANLGGARLEETTLLAGADLTGADLSRSLFNGADVSGVSLDDADLRGASLDRIRGWERIRSMKRANIYGVKNAPPGFESWAKLKMEAVALESDAEWFKLRDQPPGSLRRAAPARTTEACFSP
ncbi:MAG TPA: pentapeptide repeat-containing protein [Vicinamibacteria bacterium]|nr:pentapeptide repeat-containing protein [Vicinamibacteria bacterium]